MLVTEGVLAYPSTLLPTPLSYREHLPHPMLRPFVRCVWELAGDSQVSEPQVIVPDGCTELVLNLGDPIEQLIGVAGSLAQPRVTVVGEIRRPVVTLTTGRIDLLGVRFLPGGLQPFISTPIGEIVDRIEAHDDVLTRAMRETIARVQNACIADRLELLEIGLIDTLQKAKRLDNALTRRVVRALMDHEGCIRMEALAEEFGVTRRHIERAFALGVGASPKSLSQVLRFRRALVAIENEDEHWTDVAEACGYYDQSHLIRDFRRFAGSTRSTYLRSNHPLNGLFHGIVTAT